MPDEQPKIYQLLLYAIKQVIVMFGNGCCRINQRFQISVTISQAVWQRCFILITGRKSLYHRLQPYLPYRLLANEAFNEISDGAAGLSWSPDKGPLPGSALLRPVGIVMSGLVSIAAGLLVRLWPKAIENILPASVTGPIAMIIGLTLAEPPRAAPPRLQGATATV